MKPFCSKILAAFAIAFSFTASAADDDLSQYTVAGQIVNVGTRTMTGTLSVPIRIRIIDGGKLTLKNARINHDGVQSTDTEYAGITCLGDATITLEGDNVVRSFNGQYPCIFVKKDHTLTIEGDGSLEAAAKELNAAAGIGAGALESQNVDWKWGGSVVINSGTIRATGGIWGGAGIGAGASGGRCQNITIHGGTVIAQGGSGGAGIGGGASVDKSYSTCLGDILIDGGVVEATGGNWAAGIGGGSNSGCRSVTIKEGVQRVVATRGGTFMGYKTNAEPIGKGDSEDDTADCWYGVHIDENLIDIASDETRTVSSETIDLAGITKDTTIKNNALVTGELAANIHLTIADGATVILRDVDINKAGDTFLNGSWAGITCEGDANIILQGSNTIKSFSSASPGIFVPRHKTLTISGKGSLDARCSTDESDYGLGPGIGGSYNEHGGNIVINGGTITARGAFASAGIGGGAFKKCGDITINGGTITAIGGNGAPGIGGSAAGNCGKITIGIGIIRVTATSGDKGTIIGMDYPSASNPIGPGAFGKCDGVVIDNDLSDSIEGLTRVLRFDGVHLSTISGDTEIANNKMVTGTETGTLLGSRKITIADGATVTLKDVTIDGDHAQGIQCLGNATIILKGKNIVNGTGGYPAIFVPTNKTLTITGDGELYATGGGDSPGAGIGAGYGVGSLSTEVGGCGNIRIEGGKIVATGGESGAAGIGSAWKSSCGNITIVGGNVTAIGGLSAAGIGCGSNGKCGNINIGYDNGTALSTDGLIKFERVEARAGESKYSYDAGSPIGLSGYCQYDYKTYCEGININSRLQDTTDGLTRIISRKSVNLDDDVLGEGDTYVPEDGESMTGKTTKKVLLKRNTTVSINGVEVSGAVDAPVFDENEGKTETTEFVQSTDGETWEITTFAELSNDSVGSEVAQSQIKVYSAETLEDLATAEENDQQLEAVVVEEKKSAVMTKIKVTPPTPTPGAKSRFFKVKYGN